MVSVRVLEPDALSSAFAVVAWARVQLELIMALAPFFFFMKIREYRLAVVATGIPVGV
jgi:hypothetical protein